jgi:hypothetical protein
MNLSPGPRHELNLSSSDVKLRTSKNDKVTNDLVVMDSIVEEMKSEKQ